RTHPTAAPPPPPPGRPPPLQPRPAPAAAAAHPPPADHRDHHQPAPARLDATRTRDHARRPPPPPRHPTPRMVPARLLHPHRPGHLPAQHADAATILDKRTRPLTTRHCVATPVGRPRWLSARKPTVSRSAPSR